ncbi:MAG: hypothetical protein ABI831_15065 [Betaproteobacteria bacterium]
MYQLVNLNSQGLNTGLPSSFRIDAPSPEQLSWTAAHFIANAFKYRDFLIAHRSDTWFAYTALVVLHLLAEDTSARMRSNELERCVQMVRLYQGEPLPTYREIHDGHLWVNREFAQTISRSLQPFAAFFERSSYEPLFQFVSAAGAARAHAEQPEVWSWVVGDHKAPAE